MSWIAYGVALAVALLLQTTVCRLGEVPLLEADLLLALTLVCGLAAPAHDARLAGWMTGLAMDLMTVGPLGQHAVALGLTAWLLTRLRDTINTELGWVRFLAGFLAALPGQVLLPLHLRLVQGASLVSWWEALGLALQLSLTAALLAAALTGLPPLMPRRRRGRGFARSRL